MPVRVRVPSSSPDARRPPLRASHRTRPKYAPGRPGAKALRLFHSTGCGEILIAGTS